MSFRLPPTRILALTYLALLLAAPVGMVAYRTFGDGIGPVIDAPPKAESQHAFWLTIVMVSVAVPRNTVFSVFTALLLVRKRFTGKLVLITLIDLTFAVSPVVVGLALILVYVNGSDIGG